MIYGSSEGERVSAKPDREANCPICEKDLIPKCGDIKVWHWAHKVEERCDSWFEPETEWHLNWKKKFPKEWREKVVEKNGKKHFADVKTKKGSVIEFQNSILSKEEIKEREDFFDKIFWVLNGRNNTLGKNLDLREKEDYYSFRWKYPRKSWWSSKERVFIDYTEDKLFEIRKVYKSVPCGGWGHFVSKKDFIETLKGERE